MSNSVSLKRQIEAQIKRIHDVIGGLEDTLDGNPNDRSAREELRRQKQLLQGAKDELKNIE
jgi:hypothetical protein